MLLFLFFFFKQKTAYEMRISDWSSDVCSSDLMNHVGRERGQRFRDRAPGEQAIRHRFHLYLRVEVVQNAGAVAVAMAAAHDQQHRMAGGGLGIAGLGGRTLGTGETAGQDDVGDSHDVLSGLHPLTSAAARSEEHTSELQSLMRISYS